MFAIGLCVFAGSAGAFDLGGMLKQVEQAAKQMEPQGQPVQKQSQSVQPSGSDAKSEAVPATNTKPISSQTAKDFFKQMEGQWKRVDQDDKTEEIVLIHSIGEELLVDGSTFVEKIKTVGNFSADERQVQIEVIDVIKGEDAVRQTKSEKKRQLYETFKDVYLFNEIPAGDGMRPAMKQYKKGTAAANVVYRFDFVRKLDEKEQNEFKSTQDFEEKIKNTYGALKDTERKIAVADADKKKTDDDKKGKDNDKKELAAINKIFSVLNSAELKDAYTVCKNKESVRINTNIDNSVKQNKDQAKNAATVAERDKFEAQAKSFEKVKANVSMFAPASCLVRFTIKAQQNLNLKSGGYQTVAKALENKEFTSKFYSDVASELRYDHNEWYKEYVWKALKPGVDESSKSLYPRDEDGRKDWVERYSAKVLNDSYNLVGVIAEFLEQKLVTP